MNIHELQEKFSKEVGITIASKETSSQLEPVRNSYVTIMHQPVTLSSSTLAAKCMQE